MNRHDHRHGPDTPPASFKAWFTVCSIIALAFLGLIVWAIIRIVTHYT